MKVVVRCIYYKPVTPSCDIVEMDWNTWREFLYAKEDRRIEIVLKLLGHEYMEGNVRELAWIPLDEHISVKIKKRIRKKSEPELEKKPKPTKEEIEKYRQAVIDAFVEYGKQYPEIKSIDQEIEVMKGRSDKNIAEYMEFNTPEETAWIFLM